MEYWIELFLRLKDFFAGDEPKNHIRKAHYVWTGKEFVDYEKWNETQLEKEGRTK